MSARIHCLFLESGHPVSAVWFLSESHTPHAPSEPVPLQQIRRKAGSSSYLLNGTSVAARKASRRSAHIFRCSSVPSADCSELR